MEKEKRVEYRLDYLMPEENSSSMWDVRYFDNVNEAYGFITLNQLYNFTLVKEELIAQRRDNG
jgi:hypothetical protein